MLSEKVLRIESEVFFVSLHSTIPWISLPKDKAQ